MPGRAARFSIFLQLLVAAPLTAELYPLCVILTNNLYFSNVFTCYTCFGRTSRPSSGAMSIKLYHVVGTFVHVSLASTWL